MEKGLAVSMTQPMIQSAMETLDGMRQFAEVILNSGIAPHYLYEKKPDGKPDFKKGNVEKLMGIFIKGDQLRMHPMTAMQEVVPVNGLLSIKGDGAKALILQSGKIKKGSWKEEYEGEIEAGTYKVTITATREDTGETLSRSFSVAQAKRAGLWITQEMLQKSDGYKKKQSAWYKFPERMLKYRALGFMARDLFSDIMSGTYTLEEAQDYVQEVSTEIQTEGGATVVIPDQQFSEERSTKLTSKAATQISELNQGVGVRDTKPEEEPPPFEPNPPKSEIELPSVFHLTESALIKIDAKELEIACLQVPVTANAVHAIQSKNTNKKLRVIIMAFMAGKLEELIRKMNPEGEGPPTEAQKHLQSNSSLVVPIPGQKIQYPEQPEVEKAPADESFMEPVVGQETGEDDIQPNKGFDVTAPDSEPAPAPDPEQAQQDTPPAEEGSIPADTNKFNIEVPELPEEGRSFEVVKDLYYELEGTAGLNNEMFTEMNARLLGGKYKSKEEFCKHASVEEVNLLLNSTE